MTGMLSAVIIGCTVIVVIPLYAILSYLHDVKQKLEIIYIVLDCRLKKEEIQ